MKKIIAISGIDKHKFEGYFDGVWSQMGGDHGTISHARREKAIKKIRAWHGDNPEKKQQLLSSVDGQLKYVINKQYKNRSYWHRFKRSIKQFFNLKGSDVSIVKKLIRVKIHLHGADAMPDLIAMYMSTKRDSIRKAIKRVILTDPLSDCFFQNASHMDELLKFNKANTSSKEQTENFKKYPMSANEKLALEKIFALIDADRISGVLPYMMSTKANKVVSSTTFATRFSDVMQDMDAILNKRIDLLEHMEVSNFPKLKEIMFAAFGRMPQHNFDLSQRNYSIQLFNDIVKFNVQDEPYADFIKTTIVPQLPDEQLKQLLLAFKRFDTADSAFEEVKQALKGNRLVMPDGTLSMRTPKAEIIQLLMTDQSMTANYSPDYVKQQLGNHIMGLTQQGIFDDVFRKFSSKVLTVDALDKCRLKFYSAISSKGAFNKGSLADEQDKVSLFDPLVDTLFKAMPTAQELAQLPINQRTAYIDEKLKKELSAAFDQVVDSNALIKKLAEAISDGDRGEDPALADFAWISGSWSRKKFAEAVINASSQVQGDGSFIHRPEFLTAVLGKRGLEEDVYKEALKKLIAMGRSPDVKKALLEVGSLDSVYGFLTPAVRSGAIMAYSDIVDTNEKTEVEGLADLVRRMVPASNSLANPGRISVEDAKFQAIFDKIVKSKHVSARQILESPYVLTGNVLTKELQSQIISSYTQPEEFKKAALQYEKQFSTILADATSPFPLEKAREAEAHIEKIPEFVATTGALLNVLNQQVGVASAVNPEEMLMRAQVFCQALQLKLARNIVKNAFSILDIPEAERQQLLKNLEPITRADDYQAKRNKQMEAVKQIDAIYKKLMKEDQSAKKGASNAKPSFMLKLGTTYEKYQSQLTDLIQLDKQIAETTMSRLSPSAASFESRRFDYFVKRVFENSQMDSTTKRKAAELVVEKAKDRVNDPAVRTALLNVLSQMDLASDLYQKATDQLLTSNEGRRQIIDQLSSVQDLNSIKAIVETYLTIRDIDLDDLAKLLGQLVKISDSRNITFDPTVEELRSKLTQKVMQTGEEKTGYMEKVLMSGESNNKDIDLIWVYSDLYISKYKMQPAKLANAITQFKFNRPACEKAASAILASGMSNYIFDVWNKLIEAPDDKAVAISGVLKAILGADNNLDFSQIYKRAMALDLESDLYELIVKKWDQTGDLSEKVCLDRKDEKLDDVMSPTAFPSIIKQIIERESLTLDTQPAEGCYWIAMMHLLRQKDVKGKTYSPQIEEFKKKYSALYSESILSKCDRSTLDLAVKNALESYHSFRGAASVEYRNKFNQLKVFNDIYQRQKQNDESKDVWGASGYSGYPSYGNAGYGYPMIAQQPTRDQIIAHFRNPEHYFSSNMNPEAVFAQVRADLDMARRYMNDYELNRLIASWGNQPGSMLGQAINQVMPDWRSVFGFYR